MSQEKEVDEFDIDDDFDITLEELEEWLESNGLGEEDG